MPAFRSNSIHIRHLRLLSLFLIITAFIAANPVAAFGADDKDDGNPNAVGHSADGYYFDLMINHKIVELPRLLLVRDSSGNLRFDTFKSTHSALDSGNYTLRKVDNTLMTAEEYESLYADHKHLSFPLVPQNGNIVIDFSITRQLLFVFIAALLLLIIMLRLSSRYKKGIGRDTAPKGVWQNMLEVLITFIRDEVAKPAIGPKYEKYLSYLLTAFFFILLGNLLGLVPWGVTATSHIMVTATLAIFTFIITQFSGTKDYWTHILWPPGVPVYIKPILIPIEIIGIFTKPIALAFRLFGNMISGHIAIISLIGLIFIFTAQVGAVWGSLMIFISVPLTIFIYMLKILVSFIQAYIFVMLSAVFIGMALEEHDHAHDHAHDSTGAGDHISAAEGH